MIYVEYEYYHETYRGTMGEDDFGRLSYRASAYLDTVTFGRIEGHWQTDQRVQDTCCAVADELFQQEKGGEVVSASNDGYSETFVQSGKTPDRRLYDAVLLYLAQTGLLYCGIGGGPCSNAMRP